MRFFKQTSAVLPALPDRVDLVQLPHIKQSRQRRQLVAKEKISTCSLHNDKIEFGSIQLAPKD